MKSPFLEFLKNPFGALREREEKRRRNASWHEAYELERKGRFREAAAVCRKRAEGYRTTNELIFAGDMHDAIRLCLKAGDVATAMKDARTALEVLADAGWLESAKDSGVEALNEIVGELFVEGYAAQAEAFLEEIDARVAPFGWSMPKRDASARRDCPHCGAKVPSATTATVCEYCGGSVPPAESP